MHHNVTLHGTLLSLVRYSCQPFFIDRNQNWDCFSTPRIILAIPPLLSTFPMSEKMTPVSEQFSQLHDTVRTLLGERGCPWDKRQTNASLREHLSSELGELLTAIEREDHHNICEELGDLLYLILLISEINTNDGRFTLKDVITAIDSKLVRRHPHVFDQYTELSDDELRKQWLAIKMQEKASE